jgi:hypothetical protein
MVGEYDTHAATNVLDEGLVAKFYHDACVLRQLNV